MEFQKIDWSDENIEEFWQYWAHRPEDYFSEAFGNTIVQFSKASFGEVGTVLDFGAGSGGLLSALSRQKIISYGLDFGPKSISKLSRIFSKDQNVRGIISAAESIEFKSFFDTIFFIETIEHMPDRHLYPSIDKIYSMLKPGGWILISTPNDEDIEKAEIYCPISKVVFHPMQHLRTWNTKSLYEFLDKSGFTDINCIEIDMQALPYHSKKATIKRFIKRLFDKFYKDPHLVATARKPKD